MELTDLNYVLKIEKEVFPHSNWSRKAFEIEILSPISFPLVLILDNDLIGYIIYNIVQDEAHITNFAIKKEHQNKGFGSILLEFAINNIKNLGVKSIYLEVRVSNERALHIYEKFGFKKLYIRKKYYLDTQEDAIVMGLFFNNGIQRQA